MSERKISDDLWDGWLHREALFELYHELDMPITKLKGYCELFLKADLSEDEKRSAIEHILSQVRLLESLENSLGEYLQGLRGSQTM